MKVPMKSTVKAKKTGRSNDVMVDLDANLKKIVAARAKKSGLSSSEFVLSAVQSYFAASLNKGGEAKSR